MWIEIALGIGMGRFERKHYVENPTLQGTGMLYLSSVAVAHAVAYRDGLVSDPGRPDGAPTWGTPRQRSSPQLDGAGQGRASA